MTDEEKILYDQIVKDVAEKGLKSEDVKKIVAESIKGTNEEIKTISE